MSKRLSVFFLFILCCSLADARTVTEGFTSRQHIDSDGGAVWNIALGELHPPLLVAGWDDGGGASSTSFSVGTGQHGAFIESRYAIFDRDGVVSGGVIEIDTNTYQDLQFTSFHLASGYALRPVGSYPLVIRSLSSVVIDGIVDCSGADGTSAVSNIVSSLLGGTGRCGGGSGGASVPSGVAPGVSHQGVAGGASVTGGSGGPLGVPTGGQGGGGGGSYIKAYAAVGDKPDPTDGDDSLGGTGGAVGVIFRDDSFSVDADGAGSGGGGGSAFDDAGDVASHSSGGSGGGGGGNIRIYAVQDITVTVTGAVRADGGDGGSVAGGLKGGGGGGGGGGSVLMFAGRDIVLDGPVTAAAGAGGTSAGGDGGRGAWGRTWIVEKDGFAGGAVVEDPDSDLNLPGGVVYETGVNYTVTSIAVDVGNTKPNITSLPMTIADLGGSTLTYNLAFSSSSDLSTLSNFQLSSNFIGVEAQRFARFQIQFDNTDAVTPIRIQDLSFIYDGFEQTEFNFTTGCGSIGSASRPSGATSLLGVALLFFLPLFVFGALRIRHLGYNKV